MRSIDDLLTIMRTLRDPDRGCPWDLQQTFESIAPYTLEEAYEVADAIEHNDLDGLRDELGDLLLQVVFHAQMASEQAAFDFGDVVESICNKMTRRHPHVFGDAQASSAEEVRASWQAIKQAETPDRQSVLDGIPKALPALKRAQKLGSRAASTGFDWPDESGAFEKLQEEVQELRRALEGNDVGQVEEELGDVLFSVVNVCRHRGADAEALLTRASAKFSRRFAQVEQRINASETPLNLEQMEAAWQAAKHTES